MKLLCKVQYKGTNYQGWQKQPDAPTIQETIEKVLSQILNQQIAIFGSGRTDSGVHAQGQYFHFEIDRDLDIEKFRYSVNCLLPKDIFITEIRVVDGDFHARYSAKSKKYLYLIRFGERNAFNYDFEANIPYEVDINLLSEMLKLYEGTHNFIDFTSKEEDKNGHERTIYKVETRYILEARQFMVTFEGDGFMRYQIRFMVGAALAVASSKEDKNYITYHLSKKDNREIVSYKAAPEGLFLVDVNY